MFIIWPIGLIQQYNSKHNPSVKKEENKFKDVIYKLSFIIMCEVWKFLKWKSAIH